MKSVMSGIAAAVVAGACSPPSPDDVLRSTIRSEARAAGFSFDPRAMMPHEYSTGAGPSQILPATYYWALYYPPETSHGWFSAVAVESDGRVLLLRTLEDWARFLGSWRASTSEEALQACMEMVRYAGPRSDPFNLPVVVPPSLPSNARVIWDPVTIDSLVATLAPPSARFDDGSWTVQLWAMEMERTARYTCSLPVAANDDPPSLLVVDSVAIGLFADEH